MLFFSVTGDSFLDLRRAEDTMPSEAAFARLRKRAATSMVPVDTGVEGSGTSRSRCATSSAFKEGNSEVRTEVIEEDLDGRKRCRGEDDASRPLVTCLELMM